MTREEYLILLEKTNNLATAYYDEDAPLVSDYEYDQMMISLKNAEKEHPDWITSNSPSQKIGGTAKREAGVIVTHNVPMLSIEDLFTKEAVVEWVNNVKSVHPDATFCVEHKIDGLSMTLRYQDGKLILAETRGDGLIGEDVTANAKVIPDVMHNIPIDGYIELRGEVYMTHESFDKYNNNQELLGKKIAANPRNLAAGTLRQLDSSITAERGLSMFVFNVQDTSNDNLDYKTDHFDGLTRLSFAGIKVVPSMHCKTAEEILHAIDEIGDNRGDYPYDIDGAVVKINEVDYREDFPAGSKYSSGHIAYKYPPEEKEVEIEEIEVAVGRTGKMTFRARFKEPVRLCGTSVSRATLHNIDFIHSMNIDEGCLAICRKQGEIIPAIVSVTKPTGRIYEGPHVCPVCAGPLVKEKDTADIYCENPSCPAQLKRTISYFASRDAMDIKSFGEIYVEKLVDLGFLSSYADIYRLKEHRDRLIELGIIGKEKNTDKVLAAIEESKSNEVNRLLTGLAIRNVGKTQAKSLMKHFNSIEALSNASVDELTAINDVGEVTALCIYDFFKNDKNITIINDLISLGVNTKADESKNDSEKLNGLTFVITGTLPTLSRQEATDLIEKNGGKCSGSVSKKTSILLAGEAAGSKLDKANSLGIKVISEDELFKMIN